MAIDFTNFQRGQAEGRRALDEANRFKANESTYALQELNNIYAMQDLNIGRQAAAYVAPLATHRQRAAQQGVDPVDFLVQQQQAMLADPNFQQFSPDVQAAVNEKFQQQVSMAAETLIRNKDFAGLQRLVDTMGVVSPVGAADQASMTADVGGLVTALASQGLPATVNAEGKVIVNGTEIDPVRFNALYSQFNGNMALALGAYQQEVESKSQLDKASQIAGASAGLGLTLGIDGNYYNATTGTLAFDKAVAEMLGLPTEGGSFTPGGTAGQPPTPVVTEAVTVGPNGVTEVVDMSTPSGAKSTGLGSIVQLQQTIANQGTAALTPAQLQEVVNAPAPTVQTVLTPEEQAKLADGRTPAAERLALQQKLIQANQAFSQAKIAASTALAESQPVAPRIEDFFTTPSEQDKLRLILASLASGGSAQVDRFLQGESADFQAAFAALQQAQQAYQQQLKRTK